MRSKRDKQQEQPRRTYNWECKANGCTLPATRVTEWHDNLHGARGDNRDGAPKAGCCSYHVDNQSHNWQEITFRIRNMMPILNVIGELEQLSTAQLADCIPTEIERYPATKPLTDETMYHWIQRMMARIDRYIAADLPATTKEIARTKTDFQQIVKNALKTRQAI